jgi:hypothetical protein
MLGKTSRFAASGFLLYEIDYAPIDAANRPDGEGTVIDRVDVADWNHEHAHAYAFAPPLPPDQRSQYRVGKVAGATAVDACRQVTDEAFTLAAREGQDAVVVVRTDGTSPEIDFNGQRLALAPRAKGAWTELEARIPAANVRAANQVKAHGARLYCSFHYFLLQ